MGLDISVHINAKYVGDFKSWDELDERSDNARYVSNDAFPARLGTMKTGLYTSDCIADFRAGSYGGYSSWRNTLCEAIHKMPAEEFWSKYNDDDISRPFTELINMSDCEGTIGTSVCQKLAEDFATYAHQLDKVSDEYWQSKRQDWQDAFKEAGANNGFVDFH